MGREIEYEMTNTIAFDLGAFNYPCFYDLAHKTDFKYKSFFKFDNYGDLGELDEKRFKTLKHKHYYIKGRLSSYSVGIKNNSISIGYANSIKSRDRFVKWVRELLVSKFIQGLMFGNYPLWSIKIEDGHNTIPCTPSLILTADKEVIDFIVNGNSI
jgi:hypothetical protein